MAPDAGCDVDGFRKLEKSYAISSSKKAKETFSSLLSRLWSPFDVSATTTRFIPMEGLRGIAVLLVFCVHYHALFGGHLKQGSVLFRLSEFASINGNSGVDLFFVLSGFLIYGACLRKKASLGAFLRRRVQRIYPTFLCVFAIYLFLSVLIPSGNKIHGPFFHALAYVLANILLLPGIFNILPIISVAWSLSYEFLYYFFMPLLVALTGLNSWSRTKRLWLIAALLLAHLSLALAFPVLRVRLSMFLFGVFLFEAVNYDALKFFQRRFLDSLSILMVFAGFFTIYLIETYDRWSGVFGHKEHVHVLILGTSFFFLCGRSLSHEGFLSRALSIKPLRALGNMSYSYYLIHGLTLKLIAAVCSEFVGWKLQSVALFCGMIPISLAATFATASMLFVYVEKPLSLSTAPQLPAESNGNVVSKMQRFVLLRTRKRILKSLDQA